MEISTCDPAFLALADQSIIEHGEIFVVIRYAYAAGSRDYTLFPSSKAFQARLKELPPRTSVILIRDYQLPVRGVVDDTLIAEALRYIPADGDFVIVYRQPRDDARRAKEYTSWLSSHCADTGHTFLREGLEETRGEEVAVGLDPDWHSDTENVMEAIVPDETGHVHRGIY